MQYPARVEKLKPSLREAARLDVGQYTLPGKRGVRPYEGQTVWLDPYIDSQTERRIQSLQDALGDDPENADVWATLCATMDEIVWGWNITDKFDNPIPQPGDEGCWDAVPSWFMAHLIQEAAGVETEGEGSGGSTDSENG